jgi:phosphate starvation-inducible membrane PsiE
MFGYLPTGIALVCLGLLWLTRELLSLRANVAVVKTAGLPYAIARELMTYFLYL